MFDGEITVKCQGKEVKKGDWFVYRWGYDVCVGKCLQVVPTGLLFNTFLGTRFVEYPRILGRAEVGWFKRLLG